MTREELLKSEGYWLAKLQTQLYRELTSFMEKRHMNSTQLAGYLGCSKAYVSQLLNGNYDHKLSKLVELSLAIGKVPVLEFQDMPIEKGAKTTKPQMKPSRKQASVETLEEVSI